MTYPCIGVLWLTGYHGLTSQRVAVIAETPKRYRIQALRSTKLGGRSRFLAPGDTALVPKHAITFDDRAPNV